MEIELLQNKIMAGEQRLGQLRSTEKIFIERAAYDREAARAKLEIEEHQKRIEVEKAIYSGLVEARDDLVNKAIANLVTRLKAALPVGEPILDVADGKVDIGLMIDGQRRPYRALSGGEKVSFDLAMSAAMGAELIIKEVSELDPGRLSETLQRLSDARAQVLLVSCHDIADRFKEWTRCETPVSKSQ
jgi:hypothetical protein